MRDPSERETERQPETKVLVCSRVDVTPSLASALPAASCRWEQRPQAVVSAAREFEPQVVLFASDGEAHSVIQTAKEVLAANPRASLILALAEPDDLAAGRFLQSGGYEVVEWDPPELREAGQALRRAVERSRLLARLNVLEEELRQKRHVLAVRDWVASSVLRYGRRDGFRGMTGASEQMQELYERIERLAEFPDVNVTILGERGTGKSLVARALHELGPRRDQPFRKFLCSRFQSADARITMCDLFGWGPNPQAHGLDRQGGKGLLEEAGAGTLFLDELGDIPALGQDLLLDVVEARCFSRPLGKSDVVRVAARFVFATNRSPRELLEEGALRADFWDRIRDVLVTVPPLRQRVEDIPLLVRHFLDLYNTRFNRNVGSLTAQAIDRLKRHQWPGNVRELESTIKRALLLGDGDTIDESDLELSPDERDLQPLEDLGNRLWTLLDNGEVKFGDVVEFKREWGTAVTRRLVERAVAVSGSLKQAGVLLGLYAEDDVEGVRYAKFRSDASRLGVRASKGRNRPQHAYEPRKPGSGRSTGRSSPRPRR